MSTVLFRRHVDIAITADEAGRELAASPNDIQAAFLLGMHYELQTWTGNQCWPFQCRMIVDDMSQEDRINVGFMLKTLVDHLLEPQDRAVPS